ncbi:MAG TPA: carboxypeptidase-like regulatory domain-containing protein [Candidatus Acidoferrum sp.]|nr:carboxypeptidase-like regulatory domain-containing protein [Candidatus Acidoferrum sp.]
MRRRTGILLLLASLMCGLITSAAIAQDSKKEAQLRTVKGVVVDKSESTVPSGVVFLKNLRTNQVRSYIADNDGNFRFSGLDPNADYEVHAEKDGAKSPTRQVSSFDNRKEIVLTLKLDKKKD